MFSMVLREIALYCAHFEMKNPPFMEMWLLVPF
jgi:hypothetical protein